MNVWRVVTSLPQREATATSEQGAGHFPESCVRFCREAVGRRSRRTALIGAATDGWLWCSVLSAIRSPSIRDRSIYVFLRPPLPYCFTLFGLDQLDYSIDENCP